MLLRKIIIVSIIAYTILMQCNPVAEKKCEERAAKTQKMMDILFLACEHSGMYPEESAFGSCYSHLIYSWTLTEDCTNQLWL